MKIKRIRVRNYKGYNDSGVIELSDNFNVVVGQNNVGKTAFLESFRFGKTEPHPHRSERFAEGVHRPPKAVFEADFHFSEMDLKTGFFLAPSGQIQLPIVRRESNMHEQVMEMVLEKDRLFSVVANTGSEIHLQGGDRRALWGTSESSTYIANFKINLYNQSIDPSGIGQGHEQSLSEAIDRIVQRAVYVFDAERYNIGRVNLDDTDVLSSDASNLPNVLAKLQKNAKSFERYNRYVREIFPSIKSVTVSQTGQMVEVFIYTIDTERADLAVSLSQSGTGVSQVLAILYVMMTMKNSVIVIDEPNSFLHPGAGKKLMQIATLFDSHQFVVSTHSSEILSSIDPDTALLVTSANGESSISPIGMRDFSGLKQVLSEVGSTLSDVFGLDRIIWVEGATEAECFPLLLRYVSKKAALGVSFVPMRHTSDFEGRKTNAVAAWDLYKRISEGGSLIPPAVSFAFDRETRSAKEIDDMIRMSEGKAKFLSRRMYENYLLHAGALQSLMQEYLGDQAPTVKCIESSLAAKLKGKDVHAVDGAGIISEVVRESSDETLIYRKVEHATYLTRWLIEHDVSSLQEVSRFVEGLVPSQFVEVGPDGANH
jgi:predicted ATPase